MRASLERVIVGVDAGFAHVGIGVVGAPARGRPRLLHAEVFRSEIDASAEWVIESDLRRLAAQQAVLENLFRAWRPGVVAVECYAPRKGGAAAGGWKTAFGYGLVVGVAFTLGLAVEARWVSDMRRALGLAPEKGKKVDKAEVGKRCRAHLLAGSEDVVARRVRAADQVHAWDAIGHALASALDP